MSFWDFLKGILPEKLIHVETNNYKIEISDTEIRIGDQKISDPSIVDNVLEKLSEYKDKDSLPCQVIHKDLEDSYEQYESISIRQEESILKLKTVLPYEDIECILMARRVKFTYDLNKIDSAKITHKKLIERFSKKGNTVYNLISAGYFDELILPFIDVFKSQYEDNYVDKFKDFYYDLIRFFPIAFFVGNGTSEDQIVTGIKERLKLKVPFIRIHAIGKNNIQKVDDAIEYLDLDSSFSLKDDRFTSPSGLKAQILQIKIAG